MPLIVSSTTVVKSTCWEAPCVRPASFWLRVTLRIPNKKQFSRTSCYCRGVVLVWSRFRFSRPVRLVSLACRHVPWPWQQTCLGSVQHMSNVNFCRNLWLAQRMTCLLRAFLRHVSHKTHHTDLAKLICSVAKVTLVVKLICELQAIFCRRFPRMKAQAPGAVPLMSVWVL